jgi:hypothetical protein
MLVILGGGLFLVGGGIFMLTRPHLPDKPDRLDFNDVMSLLEQPSPRYIHFQAALDFSKKIYYTGWVPVWGNCPPDRTYPLPHPDAAGSEFTKLLGCTVTAKGSLTPNSVYRLLKNVVEHEKVVRREQRDLAELDGRKGQLWVQSNTFAEGDPQEQQWLTKTDFTGVLATYEQAMQALPEGFPRKISSNVLSKPETFVLYDGSNTYYDEKTREQFSSHYWVPVTGSGHSIFVWAPQGFEKEYTGSITGVLEPRDRSDYKTRNKGYAQFSVVTGEALPARFGLMRYQTAQEYNDAEIERGWPIILFGSLIAGAGLLGLIVYIVAPGLVFAAWKRASGSVRDHWRKQ